MTERTEPLTIVGGLAITVRTRVVVTARRCGGARFFAGEKMPVAIRIGDDPSSPWIALAPNEASPDGAGDG